MPRAIPNRLAICAFGTPSAASLRINAQSERFEEALAARGIPYVIRGAARFFDRGEVRQAITLVRGAARSGDAGGPVADAVVAVLSQMGHSTQPPEGRGEVRNRWESLQALVDLAADFGRERPDADLGAFGRTLLREERVRPPQDRVVAVGTRVRPAYGGLDWPALARCESGGDPRAVSRTGAYRGLYQFSRSTWRSVGGTGDPIAHSRDTQTARAYALYQREGRAPWPSCGRHL